MAELSDETVKELISVLKARNSFDYSQGQGQWRAPWQTTPGIPAAIQDAVATASPTASIPAVVKSNDASISDAVAKTEMGFNKLLELLEKASAGIGIDGELLKKFTDELSLEGYLTELESQTDKMYESQQNIIGSWGQAINADGIKNIAATMSAATFDMHKQFASIEAPDGSMFSHYFDDSFDAIHQFNAIVKDSVILVRMQKDISANDMKDLLLTTKALGYSEGQVQQFMKRQMALSGKMDDTLLKESLAFSNAIEAKTGISSKIISGNIAKMMKNVERFGNMTVEEMSEAAAAVAHLGLQVKDVADMSQQFDNFDDAADSVAKLTAVFGVQLDAMEMMKAANESPEEMINIVKQAFEDAGTDIASLSMPGKRVLSEALGGIGIQKIEQMLGTAGSSFSQFQKKTTDAIDGVDALDITAAVANAMGDINKLNTYAGDMGKMTQKAGQKVIAATAALAIEQTTAIKENLQTVLNQGVASAHTFTSEMADQLGLGSFAKKIGVKYGLPVVDTSVEINQAVREALNTGNYTKATEKLETLISNSTSSDEALKEAINGLKSWLDAISSKEPKPIPVQLNVKVTADGTFVDVPVGQQVVTVDVSESS